jgi:hypothetical protein
LLCTVDVFPMMVRGHHKTWREQGQRTLEWFSPEDAAGAVEEPELRALIEDFAVGTVRARGRGEDADADMTEA